MAKILYVATTPDTQNYEASMSIFLGKPKLTQESCEDCGNKHAVWSTQRGCRELMDDLCEASFNALGIPKNSRGLYRLTINVEQVE